MKDSLQWYIDNGYLPDPDNPIITQTITGTLSGNVNPLVFTFNKLSKINNVSIIYSYGDATNSFNSDTSTFFTINGNVVNFTHTTDSLNWAFTCTATGILN